MAFKLVVLAAALAVANAGLIGAPVGYAAAPVSYGYAAAPVAVGTPTLTSQSSNTLRTFGNQGQTSYEQKTIQTPFSSVSRSDVRVSNDAQILAHAPVAAYAAAAAPAYASYAAPAAYAAHSYAAPAAYAAPIAKAYAAPAYAAAPVAHAGLLGVAYSAAPVVSHMTYSSGPITYAY
ncbi:Cuticle Protein CPF 3 [Frankliniella occidentalis]|uniref:Cuticle protein 76-like n=1 Tax=Frankliniella occidentalis TaxID=133901 RepID=A0A9C6TSJ4_FRAOC|nr:cuticle protein 76-like [Frankliniella occidentalis]KAE8752869.1 Cuticle Protein CPF 3 [Frankliniella occidentalis]